MSDPLLASPRSPHPSERHDHRSDPIYARFQLRLCGVIIVTVVVLTTIVIATHDYSSSSGGPAPVLTPAFPPVPPGGWPNSFYRTTIGPLSGGNVTRTGVHWTRTDTYPDGRVTQLRYGVADDTLRTIALKVVVNSTSGERVTTAGIGAVSSFCSVTSSTPAPAGAVPAWALLNATYLSGSAALLLGEESGSAYSVTCDQWSGLLPNDDGTGYVSSLYWQRRDNGFPVRIQRVADPLNGDYWMYGFATTPVTSAALFGPWVCGAGLAPVPPLPPLNAPADAQTAATLKALSAMLSL